MLISSYGQKIGSRFWISRFVIFVFYGFWLFQNGWLRFLDICQYVLDHFWNFQKVGQILTRAPRIYHKNTSKYTRRNPRTSLNNLILHISTFKKSKAFIFWNYRTSKQCRMFTVAVLCLFKIWWVQKQSSSHRTSLSFWEGAS